MILVDRHYIDEFIKKQGLENLVGFLHFLYDKGTQDFKTFLEFKDIVIENINKVLFHGTQELTEALEPRVSTGGMNENKYVPLVYASHSPNYAIFMATIDLQHGSASFSVIDKENYELSIGLDFVHGPSSFKKGYLYVLNASTFSSQTAFEYTSEQSPHIVFVVEVTAQDLTKKVWVDFNKNRL